MCGLCGCEFIQHLITFTNITLVSLLRPLCIDYHRYNNPGWRGLLTYDADEVAEVQHGQGLTDSVISHEDVMELRHIIWMSFPVFFASLVFTKISILCLYLRFFQEKSLRYFTIGLISFVAAYAVVSICTTIFICTPVSAFWDSAAGGRCMDRKIIWMTNAAVDMLTNLITLTLPMYTLYHLKLPRKQRFGLIGVFGLAIL